MPLYTSHQALPPSMLALAVEYAFRGLFEATTWPKSNKNPAVVVYTKWIIFPSSYLEEDIQNQIIRSEKSEPASCFSCPCLITTEAAMASTITTKLNSGSMISFQKYCVYIECIQKYQSIIHLPSYPSTYLLDHKKFQMKETRGI